MSHALKSKLDRIQSTLDEVMDEREASADERVEALVSAYRAEKSRAAGLNTKLAMRDQQLREADAELARLKADKTPVDTAPEPWEAIVTAAIRWRQGTDRGELAAAVDALLGQDVGPQGSVAIVGGVLYPQKVEASDLAGLARRESQGGSTPRTVRRRRGRSGLAAGDGRVVLMGVLFEHEPLGAYAWNERTVTLPTVAGMYHRGWREEIRLRGYGGLSWRIASSYYALLGRLYLAQLRVSHYFQ